MEDGVRLDSPGVTKAGQSRAGLGWAAPMTVHARLG